MRTSARFGRPVADGDPGEAAPGRARGAPLPPAPPGPAADDPLRRDDRARARPGRRHRAPAGRVRRRDVRASPADHGRNPPPRRDAHREPGRHDRPGGGGAAGGRLRRLRGHAPLGPVAPVARRAQEPLLSLPAFAEKERAAGSSPARGRRGRRAGHRRGHPGRSATPARRWSRRRGPRHPGRAGARPERGHRGAERLGAARRGGFTSSASCRAGSGPDGGARRGGGPPRDAGALRVGAAARGDAGRARGSARPTPRRAWPGS